MAMAASAGQTGGNGLVDYLSCTEYLKHHACELQEFCQLHCEFLKND